MTLIAIGVFVACIYVLALGLCRAAAAGDRRPAPRPRLVEIHRALDDVGATVDNIHFRDFGGRSW